ncbi:17290_t:CDS:2, partial [Funneliformis caledonium]
LKRSIFNLSFQNVRTRKLVKTEGPVDVSKNFYVSFETLESTYKLKEAINKKVEWISAWELPQDSMLVGVPLTLNSAKIIEVSDFTKEQHVTFFYNIQENRNLHFNEKVVVDDIYSCTNGYARLEDLFASLCIEYASNGKTLDFSTWNDRFTEFIRNPTKKKISAVKYIENYLSDNTDN